MWPGITACIHLCHNTVPHLLIVLNVIKESIFSFIHGNKYIMDLFRKTVKRLSIQKQIACHAMCGTEEFRILIWWEARSGRQQALASSMQSLSLGLGLACIPGHIWAHLFVLIQAPHETLRWQIWLCINMSLFKHCGPYTYEELFTNKSKVNYCFLLTLGNLCQKINL